MENVREVIGSLSVDRKSAKTAKTVSGIKQRHNFLYVRVISANLQSAQSLLCMP